MLVLVSFGLVLLATILLVVGLLNDDGLTLIYLSIAASAAAAVVLYVAFRKAKPQAGADAVAAPAPLADDIAPSAIDETAAVPVVEAEAPPVAAAPEPEPTPAAVDADEDWMADADWEDEGVVDFPIADYDDLTVAEIMPLLPQLYSDEIDDVIAREQAGKNRSTIVQRLEELKQTGTEADAAEAAAEAEAADDAVAPAPAPAAAAAPAPATSLLDDDEDDAYFFPIADYDALSVSQITPLLPQLEADELEEVREREVSGAGRKTILNEIDRLLGGAPAPAPAAAPAKKSPAKKAARKTTAKKATQKKAAQKKAATKKKATKKKSATKAKKAAKKKAAPRFPIANYDELTVADIRPRLTDLSDRQLEQVREREESGAGRKTILKDIDNRLS